MSVSIASNHSDVSFVDRDPRTTVPAVLAPPPTPVVPLPHRGDTFVRHPEHYYPNGDIKLRVDDTVYQLHTDVLARHSIWYSTFRERLLTHNADPLPSGWHEVSTEVCMIYVHHKRKRTQIERPSMFDHETGAIVIEGVTVDEMDAYLSVVYARNFITFDLATLEEWKAVLKVADDFESPAIRALAIDRLDGALEGDMTLEPFERLILARRYDIEVWATLALDGLVRREKRLEPNEIAQMLPEDAALVAAAREDIALHTVPPTLMGVADELAGEVTEETTERPAESYVTAGPSPPNFAASLPIEAVGPPLNASNNDSTRPPAMTVQSTFQSPSGQTEGPEPQEFTSPHVHASSEPAEGDGAGSEGGHRRAHSGSSLRALTLPARYSLG
ncbi:unnamed protein product [Peniophora sp. CBMAI 1063]|nr:unnamed protein product [Peniophora sp. CBMAI 1063]